MASLTTITIIAAIILLVADPRSMTWAFALGSILMLGFYFLLRAVQYL